MWFMQSKIQQQQITGNDTTIIQTRKSDLTRTCRKCSYNPDLVPSFVLFSFDKTTEKVMRQNKDPMILVINIAQ